MDKTLAFELIAGSWATVTVILVLGFLTALRTDFTKRFDRVDSRLTELEDRRYNLSIKKERGEL